MQTETYFLLEDGERDVIVHGHTGLHVNVFGLEVDRYQPTAGEIHIFGETQGEWLAFETEGWAMEDINIISGAVLWYARYLDNPAMRISEEDPRAQVKLRKYKFNHSAGKLTPLIFAHKSRNLS